MAYLDRAGAKQMKRNHSFAAVLVTIVLLAAPRTQYAAELPPAIVVKVETAVSKLMSAQSVPALSLAVVTDHQLAYSNGFGFADLENYVPAKSSSVYRLGSISKSITALAVMQVAAASKIDLDAPVQQYCPAFPEKRWPVTARQLLGHLGGVRHYQGDEISSARHYENWVEGLNIFKDDPLLHEPGTKYSYTTYGFNVLGCAVEGASGETFPDYIRKHIFAPAAMDRIQLDDVHHIIHNRVRGYQKAENGAILNCDLADTSYKIPGGGLSSTVEDLAKFAIAMQNGSLVSEKARNEMWTRQKTRDGEETTYGLGWQLGKRGGLKEVGHGGGQQGTTTYLYMLPEKRLAVVLMTNLEGVQGLRDLAAEIAGLVLQ